MRGDVEVAEAEPGRLGAVRGELVLDPPRLALPAPAPLAVVNAGQRVHDAVEVGADPQTVQRDVVAGVDDGDDFVVRAGRADPAQETSAADTAGQDRNSHWSNLRHGEFGFAASQQQTDLAETDLTRPEFDRAGPQLFGQVVVPAPGVVLEVAVRHAERLGHGVQLSPGVGEQVEEAGVPQTRVGVLADGVDVTGHGPTDGTAVDPWPGSGATRRPARRSGAKTGQRLAATSRPSPT